MDGSQRTLFLTAFGTPSLNNMHQGTCLGWQDKDAWERKKLFLWFQFLAVILEEQRSLPCCWCKLSVMIYPQTVTLPSCLFVVHKLFTVLMLQSASLSTQCRKYWAAFLASAHTALPLFPNWMQTALEIKFPLQMLLLTSSESAVWELALLCLRGVCPKIMPAYTFPDLENP